MELIDSLEMEMVESDYGMLMMLGVVILSYSEDLSSRGWLFSWIRSKAFLLLYGMRA